MLSSLGTKQPRAAVTCAAANVVRPASARLKTKTPRKNDGGERTVHRSLSWASRFVCVLSGALIVALLQVVWKFPNKRPAPRELTKNIVAGPWGRLELTPFLLEKPPEMLPDPAMELHPTRWHFGGQTKAQTIAFLKTCALTAAQLEALTASNALTEV